MKQDTKNRICLAGIAVCFLLAGLVEGSAL